MGLVLLSSENLVGMDILSIMRLWKLMKSGSLMSLCVGAHFT
jgi:hypothetical protein